MPDKGEQPMVPDAAASNRKKKKKMKDTAPGFRKQIIIYTL